MLQIFLYPPPPLCGNFFWPKKFAEVGVTSRASLERAKSVFFLHKIVLRIDQIWAKNGPIGTMERKTQINEYKSIFYNGFPKGIIMKKIYSI